MRITCLGFFKVTFQRVRQREPTTGMRLLSWSLGPETPGTEQLSGPFGYSQSSCDLPLCSRNELIRPKTEDPIGSFVTFPCGGPQVGSLSPNLLRCCAPPHSHPPHPRGPVRGSMSGASISLRHRSQR